MLFTNYHALILSSVILLHCFHNIIAKVRENVVPTMGFKVNMFQQKLAPNIQSKIIVTKKIVTISIGPHKAKYY